MLRALLALLTLLSAPAWAQSRFEIIRATYGAGSTVADVTERVRSLVAGDGLNLQVTPDILGGDPVPNTQKTLTIEYRQGRGRRTARAKDFETIRIGNPSAQAATPPVSLRITKAAYGDGRRMKDVADILNSRIAANALELAITNANMGGDPAPAVKKSITVEYVYNGQTSSTTIAEGETLRLPTGAVAAVAITAAPVATLRIVRANYGAGRRATSDVTRAVSARVVNNTLELTVNGDTLGGDPAPGVIKTLTVEYEVNGQGQTATARDGELLRLPTGTVTTIAPRVATAVASTAGACLYRQTNYTGESVCLSPGQSLAAVANWQSGFRSVRLNGASAMDLFDQPNYNGRNQSVTADTPDLLAIPGTWWRYDSAAAVQSVRIR